jgi:ribosomal protein S18 acetylase RimI-like enzyme
MNAAEDHARTLGCCKLTLEVLARNQVACSAYRNFGFTAYGLAPSLGEAQFWEKLL